MKRLFFAIAIASTMVTSSASAAVAPTVVATPSLEFCQKSFANVLDNNTNVFQQMFDDEDRAGLIGQNKQTQTGICLIYYKGMMDYISATGPKT